jgi:hypothetical protein
MQVLSIRIRKISTKKAQDMIPKNHKRGLFNLGVGLGIL